MYRSDEATAILLKNHIHPHKIPIIILVDLHRLPFLASSAKIDGLKPATVHESSRANGFQSRRKRQLGERTAPIESVGTDVRDTVLSHDALEIDTGLEGHGGDFGQTFRKHNALQRSTAFEHGTAELVNRRRELHAYKRATSLKGAVPYDSHGIGQSHRGEESKALEGPRRHGGHSVPVGRLFGNGNASLPGFIGALDLASTVAVGYKEHTALGHIGMGGVLSLPN